MKHLKFLSFSILSATLISFFEVQMEGRLGYEGWGRVPSVSQISFWILILVLLHSTFVNRSWNIKKEMGVISFFIFTFFLEGIFWYLVNPALGINKLVPESAVWKKEPWLLLPSEYWIKLGAALVLYIVSNIRND